LPSFAKIFLDTIQALLPNTMEASTMEELLLQMPSTHIENAEVLLVHIISLQSC
jgi:hypothetical protein